MKPYINIYFYEQTQTVATNIYYYTQDGTIIKETHTRYIVDHVWEVISPIVEQYGNTHDISIYSLGEHLDINKIEASYFAYMNE